MNPLFYAIMAAITLLICWVMWREWQKRQEEKRRFETALRDLAYSVLTQPQKSERDSLGTKTYEGQWSGEHVQIRFIMDTLATRKLPVLWLSITVFADMKINGKYDLMNRPAGLNSFSNFNQLATERPLPSGFSGQVELRSDQYDMKSDIVPSSLIYFMREPNAKEFLVTPKGVRFVMMLSEASRVYYGVFRNANFGDLDEGSAALERRLNDLLTIKTHINQ